MSARGQLGVLLGSLVAACASPDPDPLQAQLALTVVQRLELEPPIEAFRVRQRPIGCWLDRRGRAWVALLGTGVHVFAPDGEHVLAFRRPEGSLGLYAPIFSFEELADGRVLGATHDTLEEFEPATGEWRSSARSGPWRLRSPDGSALLELGERRLAWTPDAAESARLVELLPRPACVFSRAALHVPMPSCSRPTTGSPRV